MPIWSRKYSVLGVNIKKSLSLWPSWMEEWILAWVWGHTRSPPNTFATQLHFGPNIVWIIYMNSTPPSHGIPKKITYKLSRSYFFFTTCTNIYIFFYPRPVSFQHLFVNIPTIEHWNVRNWQIKPGPIFWTCSILSEKIIWDNIQKDTNTITTVQAPPR